MSNALSVLGGSGSQPGLMGTGMYQVPGYNINQGAFNNPNFQPGQYQQQANNYLGATTAPVVAQQAGAGDYSNFNKGMAGQLGLAQQYQNMAAGNGPSLAAVQARQQGAQNLAATESMLGSARGAGSPAAAQLAARQAASTGQQQIAQNAVAGRTAEELGAMQGAAGLYGNIAGQGLGQVGQQQQLGMFNAGQGNQIGMSNQANTLSANTNYLNSLAAQGLAQQQGQMGGQQLGVQQQLGAANIQQQAYQGAANQNAGMFGGLLNGASSALGQLAPMMAAA